MNPKLRILHLEDNPDDALLVRDLLAHDELRAEVLHVGNRPDFARAISEEKWELVISDYRLPGFTGLDALKLVRERSTLLPFILIFMILLINKYALMKEWVNPRAYNFIAWATVIIVIGMTVALTGITIRDGK